MTARTAAPGGASFAVPRRRRVSRSRSETPRRIKIGTPTPSHHNMRVLRMMATVTPGRRPELQQVGEQSGARFVHAEPKRDELEDDHD